MAEVVQSMEELVTFTKNLSPGMTSMTKQVDSRTEDLTNPSHADILTAESDQVLCLLHTHTHTSVVGVTLVKHHMCTKCTFLSHHGLFCVCASNFFVLGTCYIVMYIVYYARECLCEL